MTDALTDFDEDSDLEEAEYGFKPDGSPTLASLGKAVQVWTITNWNARAIAASPGDWPPSLTIGEAALAFCVSAERIAALSSSADIPASAIMHRPGMSRDDLAACCAANAAAMHAGNLRDLLEDVAGALQAMDGVGELLKDPQAVHLNMLRGGIAKLTAAQIGHIYRGDEARAVIAEIMRQNPGITHFTAPSPPVVEGWRGIGSAPVDGTWFVAFQLGDTYPCSWARRDDGDGAGESGWFDYFNQSFEEPTHWFPSPTKPEQPQ